MGCRAQVYEPDLTAFFARGGKVLQYVGWDDELIAPGNSVSALASPFPYPLSRLTGCRSNGTATSSRTR